MDFQLLGVAEDDLDGMWDRYRLAAAFCLDYPVVAGRGMDLDMPARPNSSTCACAARDHDWLSILS